MADTPSAPVDLAPLDAIVRADPVAAPLASLQRLALAAFGEGGWAVAEAVADPDTAREEGVPLLHGRTLTVPVDRAQALLRALAGALARQTGRDLSALDTALADGRLNPLPLLAAAIRADGSAFVDAAEGIGADPPLLATLADLAALPLLLAHGQLLSPPEGHAGWQRGYCPVCGAWPTLAEVRGVERQRWLRCGRCGAAWRYPGLACVYCGDDDHRRQGYLAPEAQREARQATTCDTCRGYLKAVAAFDAFDQANLFAADLASLELDAAAAASEYVRPEGLGFPLQVTVRPR